MAKYELRPFSVWVLVQTRTEALQRRGDRPGYVEFPKEILRPPRSVAGRLYTDIRRWTVRPKGGHFAALEQPEALSEKIRAFFRPLR